VRSQLKAISLSTIFKGSSSAFEDVAHCATDLGVFQGTALIFESRHEASERWSRSGDDHLVSIGVDDEVRVVGNDDDLASRSGFAKVWH
jgi:hypothetical protein